VPARYGSRREPPPGFSRLRFPTRDGRWLLWRANGSADNEPLLLCLHGRAEGAVALARSSGIGPAAVAAGFAVAVPQGRGLVADWDPDRDLQAISELRAHLPVSVSACVVVGMSQGAQLAAALLRERPDDFAGLVAVAGVPGPMPKPGSAHPRLYIHGDQDEVVPVRTVVEHVAAVAADSGCGPGGPDGRVPGVGEPAAGNAITVYRHPLGADVSLVRLAAGGHVWPGTHEPHPRRFGPVVSWPATAAVIAFAARCVAGASG
jgi:pimeloyl-ACP methyl ester carboxylesterase